MQQLSVRFVSIKMNVYNMNEDQAKKVFQTICSLLPQVQYTH